MKAYGGESVFYADLHNHCNISYGHGDLEDALKNARQRLDVCSVTGHAAWPDMPARDGTIDHIVDFHERGFAKLKAGWKQDLATMRRFDRNRSFLVFPGFEIHSMAAGDYTVLSRDLDVDIIYPASIDELKSIIRTDPRLHQKLLAFPHHIGYLAGRRGINWDAFSEDVSPVLEVYSMHGCAEEDENDRPFLHTMGPLSARGTMQFGLGTVGAKFGVLANTDHHSAHPGSYGHGLSGIWAESLERESVWQAIQSRRTYALSADKMRVAFSVNNAVMGAVTEMRDKQRVAFEVTAGGTLDHVDVIKNGRLHRRTSQADITPPSEPRSGRLRTILYLEVGWGERNVRCDWSVRIALSGGTIDQVDARFRGDEVVSPLDEPQEAERYFRSWWDDLGESAVEFHTETRSNPTNSTPGTQGIALHVTVEPKAVINCMVNGKEYRIAVADLFEGSFVDYLGGFDSPAFKLHRAPFREEYHWSAAFDDTEAEPAYYYLRARQKNGALAWSSPVWVE